jgi:hypothetical protein
LQHARSVQADGGNSQTFLEDVGVAAIGEIGVVCGIDRPAPIRPSTKAGSRSTMSGRWMPPPA